MTGQRCLRADPGQPQRPFGARQLQCAVAPSFPAPPKTPSLPQ